MMWSCSIEVRYRKKYDHRARQNLENLNGHSRASNYDMRLNFGGDGAVTVGFRDRFLGGCFHANTLSEFDMSVLSDHRVTVRL